MGKYNRLMDIADELNLKKVPHRYAGQGCRCLWTSRERSECSFQVWLSALNERRKIVGQDVTLGPAIAMWPGQAIRTLLAVSMRASKSSVASEDIAERTAKSHKERR